MVEFLKNKKFILLNENKEPTHSLSLTYSYKDSKNYPNLGVLVDNNFVVIDVDDSLASNKMYEYIKKQNYKCHIMQTTRGLHFWFKNAQPLPNLIKKQNALSIKCDVRSFGKKSFVVVKQQNKWREWLLFSETVNELPKELIPRSDYSLNELPSLIGMKEGDGRRDALFRRTYPLSLWFDKNELLQFYRIWNRILFVDPLNDPEIKHIFHNNPAFDKTENKRIKNREFNLADFFENQTFQFNLFADYIHDNLQGITAYNNYWIYQNKKYVRDKKYVFSLMQKYIPTLKQHQRNEIYAYLELKENERTIIKNPMILNCKNGVLDLNTLDLMEHSNKFFDLNLIDTNYDPRVKDPNVIKFLKDISNNDEEIYTLLTEMMGTFLVKDNRWQKAYVLLGDGANGKSTFLEALKVVFGKDNYSSLEFDAIVGNRFAISDLVFKMLNISTELPNKKIEETHTFKKLVSGEELRAENKFENGFYFENYAKLVFAANDLPGTKDRSFGFFRRFIIIPFTNTFTNEKADLTIKDKLITESAKSTFLNLAIEGLKNLLKNKRFTHSDKSDAALNDFMNNNNSVSLFLEAEKGYVIDSKLKTLYDKYVRWCNELCLKAEVLEFFKSEIIRTREYKIVTIKIGTEYHTLIKRMER